MKASVAENPIPVDIAIQLCAEIRAESEQDWQTPAARWCWSCREYAGGDPAKRGFLRQAGNRGCALINARYALLQGSKGTNL